MGSNYIESLTYLLKAGLPYLTSFFASLYHDFAAVMDVDATAWGADLTAL
jgi:hypothetical protein